MSDDLGIGATEVEKQAAWDDLLPEDSLSIDRTAWKQAPRHVLRKIVEDWRARQVGAVQVETAPQSKPGPQPLVTVDEVLAKKAELEATGRPAGYGSLAEELTVSRSTVKRRLRDHRKAMGGSGH